MNRPPNIVFVLTDQQTRGAVGAYGHAHLRTPHLDGLARQGVCFWNSYCASPVCGPARASLVTGRLPHQVGVDVNEQPLRRDVPSLAELFRTADYETAWAGKWHLPDLPTVVSGDLRGFRSLPLPPPGPSRLGTCTDGGVADAAIEFLRQPHPRPFLLGVSLQNPHDICHWIMGRDRTVLDRFLPAGPLPPLPANFAADPDEPEFIALCRSRDHYGPEQLWTKSWDDRQWRTYLYVYYRLVEHADANLGRVLAALGDAGLADDTLVLFTSDHGEGVAAHRWVVKLMLYEEPVTVPFIVRWPGRVPAARFDRTHLVSGLDVLPTLCDYAGIAPPAGLPGRSLKPVIDDPAAPGADHVVAELQPDTERPELRARMLRTARYKYVAFSHGRRPELFFDLDADPGETRNLVAVASCRAERDRHRALLEQWGRQTGDTFRLPPPG